ncbi:LarC family nickel insertion protein [Heyndrickxia acidicola]|uniref:LarC family nickel insertion protein n=1 Tax=Heyndrickxia acidicola TaxID=209389 RepID=A0ABU6MEE5_9BACI|nr:LarC family nickel insertion protein [Heyndrickxia acidicola]MED1203050.1 LarC family nickel insertion protein [Heyndrickxia acidicola]
MKTLYFDCFSGMSGDMVIGALIDAGADPSYLEEELKKLQIEEEYEIEWKRVIKNGISSTKFDVRLINNSQLHHHELDKEHDRNHHHQSHEEVEIAKAENKQSNQNGQARHDDDHHHDHHHHEQHQGHHHGHHHGHQHRAYQDIVNLIHQSELSDQVKNTALKIFKVIGESEGRIHGIPLEKVHFHEVGAVDSIIDIVGASILLHQLEISSIKCSPIPVGTGKIHIDHGIYPVPAPATLDLLKGIPIESSEIRAELTTPTGAAIAAVLAEEFCSIPSMRITSIGYGAGTKSFPQHPNVLRVIIGE